MAGKMTYTILGIIAVLIAICLDLFIFQTKLVSRKIFWYSYSIILFFQFVSNGMFTGFGIVKYNDAAILGPSSPAVGSPSIIGDGRLFFAPLEDVLFGFSLVLLSLVLWIHFERKGIQNEIKAGPPRVRWFGKRSN
jgi:hypothetical protein